MIRARVNISTAKASYKPGEIIHEKLSDADMAYLKKHNFITTDDEAAFAGDEGVSAAAEPISGFGIDFNSDDDNGIEYKDEAALQKLKKDEIVDYAASIGLELDEAALKNDLIDAILNYIEERTA